MTRRGYCTYSLHILPGSFNIFDSTDRKVDYDNMNSSSDVNCA